MVDQYVRFLLEENAALRRDLEAAPAALRDRAGISRPQRLPTPRHYDIDTPAEASLGFRAEQLLRQAERQAAEMHIRATRNAEAAEAAARESAKERLRVAGKQAEVLRSRAAEEATRAKTQVSEEAARVSHVYRSMKEELRRVAKQLNAEMQRPGPGLDDLDVETSLG